MMKKLLYIISVVIIILSVTKKTVANERLTTDDSENDFYCIEIGTFPISEYNKGIKFYSILKEKGYLVFYDIFKTYKKEEQPKTQLAVFAGYFDNENTAKTFGDKFKIDEGINYSIAKTRLFIDKYKDQFEIITTSSGIWYKTIEKNIEIFRFAKDNKEEFYSFDSVNTLISPCGKYIVFCYDSKIIKVNIITCESQILVASGENKQIGNSGPAWSYDGNYIAYVDESGWEVTSSLWVIKADGTEDKCLVKNGGETQYSVKFFLWHPDKNIIFFCDGYAFGTVSVGGNIYSIDLKGERKELITANKGNREEIGAGFSFKDNFIFYTIAHFDEEYDSRTYTNHKFEIPDNKLPNEENK